MTYTVKREIYAAPEIVEYKMTSLSDWENIQFESSSGKTQEFMEFCKMYKATVEQIARDAGLQLVKWSNGHFYCSAFFENPVTAKLVYLCCSDVRFFRNSWSNNILIRTAKNDTDYSGGTNNTASLETLRAAMARLSTA